MRLQILTILLLFSQIVQSQEEIKQNIWTSFQVSKKSTKGITSFDTGFRLNDHFIRRPRQGFARIIHLFQINQSAYYLGGGIAYFEHTVRKSSTWDSELRPFLQVQSQRIWEKSSLKWRGRNEFRVFYERNKVVNRSRVQIQYAQEVFNPKLKFQITEELFYSLNSNSPFENRAAAGFQYEFTNNLQVGSQYIIQWQQANATVAQHIFAFNLNYTF